MILFIYLFDFWLCWVFAAMCGLSLAVVSGGFSCCRSSQAAEAAHSAFYHDPTASLDCVKRIHFEAHLNQFVKLPEALTDDLLKSRYDYCLLGSHKRCPSYENSNQVSFAWFDVKKPVVFAVHVHFILLMLELLSLFPYTAEIKERFESSRLPAAGCAAHPTLSSPSCIAPGISLMCVFNPTQESELLSATGFSSSLCSWMILLSFQGRWQESSISRSPEPDTSPKAAFQTCLRLTLL